MARNLTISNNMKSTKITNIRGEDGTILGTFTFEEDAAIPTFAKTDKKPLKIERIREISVTVFETPSVIGKKYEMYQEVTLNGRRGQCIGYNSSRLVNQACKTEYKFQVTEEEVIQPDFWRYS